MKVPPEKGDWVRVTGVMQSDPDPIPVGTMGRVVLVLDHTDWWQSIVNWEEDSDGRRRRIMLLDSDPYEVIGSYM